MGLLVSEGYAPEPSTLNLIKTDTMADASKSAKLRAKLPWPTTVGDFLGVGTRLAVQYSAALTLDLNVETDFTNANVVLLISKYISRGPIAYEASVDSLRGAMKYVEEKIEPAMLAFAN